MAGLEPSVGFVAAVSPPPMGAESRVAGASGASYAFGYDSNGAAGCLGIGDSA